MKDETRRVTDRKRDVDSGCCVGCYFSTCRLVFWRPSRSVCQLCPRALRLNMDGPLSKTPYHRSRFPLLPLCLQLRSHFSHLPHHLRSFYGRVRNFSLQCWETIKVHRSMVKTCLCSLWSGTYARLHRGCDFSHGFRNDSPVGNEIYISSPQVCD